VPAETAIHQDRMENAQRLAQRHIQLQARQLAAELAVELRCRAKAAETDSQESAKQHRLDITEVISAEENQLRLQERHEHRVHTLEKAHYLEWATAAERLDHQDTLAKRRHEIGLVRKAEHAHQLELRRQHELDVDERQRSHELALLRAREEKAAQYDAKIARIQSMELKREEMLDEMARMRQNAYTKFDELKALAYESAVENNDDMLRRLLEELVPSLSSIPHTKRGSFHRATSAGPCRLDSPWSFSGSDSPYSSPKSPKSPRRETTPARPQSARAGESHVSSFESPGWAPGCSRRVGPETPRRETTRARPQSARAGERRVSSLESPGWARGCGQKVGLESPRACCPVEVRLAGIGGAVRRPMSPGSTRKRQTDKGASDSRSTSATSLANSGLFSSYGSASLESMSVPSPVGSQVRHLLNAIGARDQPLAASVAVASNPVAPVDCPLCYMEPRHPQRGIDIATYANFARGVPAWQLETSAQMM